MNEVKQRSLGMLAVGRLAWLVYWGLTNTLTAVKTIGNMILQQAITFGGLREEQRLRRARARCLNPDYDWNAYYKGNPVQRWWKRQLANKVIAIVGDCNPVVDLGCGSSPILSMLPSRSKIGIDINKQKVDFMGARDLTSAYMVRGAEDTGLEDGFAAVVVCTEVIEHHTSPHTLVREIARIAKPNGKIIIATPDFSSPLWYIVELLYRLFMRSGYELEHGSKFTETGVRALAASYGLTHVQTQKILRADLIMEFTKP